MAPPYGRMVALQIDDRIWLFLRDELLSAAASESYDAGEATIVPVGAILRVRRLRQSRGTQCSGEQSHH
jgi:hypothetical protein